MTKHHKSEVPPFFRETLAQFDAILKNVQSRTEINIGSAEFEFKVKLLLWQASRADDPDAEYIVECLHRICREHFGMIVL